MSDLFSEMAERVQLDMEAYALRQTIDGRRRVIADALRAAHQRGYDAGSQRMDQFLTVVADNQFLTVVADMPPGPVALEADRDHWRKVAENKCKARMEEERLKFEALAELDEANARIRELDGEVGRLRKLFDDAGHGEHNVLALVESYQRNSMEADARLRAVRKLLEENGCDCPCDHHPDERGPDCDVCLACLIGEVVGN